MNQYPLIKTAYILGISNYQRSGGIQKLQTPRLDAQAFAKMLKQNYGFHVQLFEDGISLKKFRAILHEISSSSPEEKEQFIFYFAGHGWGQENRQGKFTGFLIPQDASWNDNSSWLPMNEVYDAFLERDPHHLLIILDCCFAGNFRQFSRYRSLLPPAFLFKENYLRYKNNRVWYALTSAAHDEDALDLINGLKSREGEKVGMHSPFAYYLIQGLSGIADPDQRGIITLPELFVYIIKELNNTYEHEIQTPGLWPLKEHQKGEFIFESAHINLPSAPYLEGRINPYKGLKSYEQEDYDLFFGRQKVCKDLLNRTLSENFVILVGKSGNGKSSLVKAKLIPEMKQLLKERGTFLPVMRPGENPEMIMRSMLGALHKTGPDPFAQIANWLEEHHDRKLFWVIDQFEELISHCNFTAIKESFLDQLYELLKKRNKNLHLIITLRADFEPHFSEGRLSEFWKKEARFELPDLTLEELREVIYRPAQAVGIFFDPPNLADKLAGQVLGVNGALPLLSYTMEELFLICVDKPKQERTITMYDYEKINGIIGALKAKAEKIHAEIPSDFQLTLKKIMLRMVSAEGGEYTKKAIYESELAFEEEGENERVSWIIDRLVKDRLLVKDQDHGTKEVIIEPAHDELIRSWPRLGKWVDDFGRHNLKLLHQVSYATRLYIREEGGLWNQDPQLNQALILSGIKRKKNYLVIKWFDRLLSISRKAKS